MWSSKVSENEHDTLSWDKQALPPLQEKPQAKKLSLQSLTSVILADSSWTSHSVLNAEMLESYELFIVQIFSFFAPAVIISACFASSVVLL